MHHVTARNDATLREANIAVAERVLRACGDLQAASVRDDFAPDAVFALPYAPPGTPRETVGRDAIVAFVTMLGDFFPPGAFTGHTFDTLAGDPGQVIARYAVRTTLLTTGKPYENTYITLLAIRDGQVARLTEFFDPLSWLTATEEP
jgi:uncharacterized protein